MLYKYFYHDNWVPWLILFGQSRRGQLMLDDTLVSALLLDGSSWNLPLFHQHLAMDVFYIIKRKLPPQRVAATESCRILINTRSTWSNQVTTAVCIFGISIVLHRSVEFLGDGGLYKS